MKTTVESFLDKAENRRAYQQEKLIVDATEMIASLMESKDVSRAELAKRIGKSRAYVTQILSGSQNLTLRTLADLLWALDSEARLQAGAPARGTSASPPAIAGTSRIAASRSRKRAVSSGPQRLKPRGKHR